MQNIRKIYVEIRKIAENFHSNLDRNSQIHTLRCFNLNVHEVINLESEENSLFTFLN